MAIVLVGVCVGGKIRRNGSGIDIDGRRKWGITDAAPCEKCGGKGCTKKPAAEANAEQ